MKEKVEIITDVLSENKLTKFYKIAVISGVIVFVLTKPIDLYYQTRLQDIFICLRNQDLNFVKACKAVQKHFYGYGDEIEMEIFFEAKQIKTISEREIERKITRDFWKKMNEAKNEKDSH